nr:hypothetical protein [Acidithiobacillus ferruginosus]
MKVRFDSESVQKPRYHKTLPKHTFICRHRHGCRGGVNGNGGSARKLLDERYARGEIERDEYLEKRNHLGK